MPYVSNLHWTAGLLDRPVEVRPPVEYGQVGFSGEADVRPTPADVRGRLRAFMTAYPTREIHASAAWTLREGNLDEPVERLLDTIDLAADAGAPVVTVHTALANVSRGHDNPAWRQALTRLADRAAARGVRVGIENLLLWLGGTKDGFEWICGLGHPALGVTLDVGHMHLADGRPLHGFGGIGHVIRSLGPGLFELHLHDFDGARDHIELGTGRIDYDDVLLALREIGYGGGAALEFRPEWNSPGAEARSAEFLMRRSAALGLRKDL